MNVILSIKEKKLLRTGINESIKKGQNAFLGTVELFEKIQKDFW